MERKLLIFCILLFAISFSASSQALSSVMDKTLKKEYKGTLKEFKKGGWTVFASTQSLDDALEKYFQKRQSGGGTPIVGRGEASNNNLANSKARVDAIKEYATMLETKIEAENNMSFIKYILLFLFVYQINSIRIEGRVQLEEPSSERIKKTTVSLIWGNQISYITNNGQFFFNVDKPGYYLIKVNDDLYDYPTMFLDVKEDEIKAYDYNYRYGKGPKHKYPVVIKSSGKIEVGEKEGNIIQSIIKSPYAIMIGMGLMFFLCMKMVPQEELRAQQEEMRKQMKNYKGFFS